MKTEELLKEIELFMNETERNGISGQKEFDKLFEEFLINISSKNRATYNEKYL